ncbi:hypothetical protein SLS59_002786 [Nothophoma quercina]|uniref:Alpha-galactosidase n=1 Tax=Nothophoma quercina TaxID=749835 RepID=A0ABR3RRL9_9PLEO
MVDVWSSAAVKVPRIMPLDSTVSYPIDEIPFSSMSADFTSNFINNPATYESPLMTEMIKLNRILLQVIDFNRRCVSEHLEGEALEMGVRSLSRELSVWLESLPHHMRDTPENFKWFADRGFGRMFAALYLGYYHYGQLLNYQFLGADGFPNSTLYAADCKHHASRLCEVVYRSFATPGSDVLYPAVAHILNNWNAFGCDVSEDLLYTTSEQILSLGLRDLGFDHVVLDDCWQDVNGRDENGKLQPELSKFPNGLRSISDHLHSQGLKYGMYSSAAGSLDHEVDDANSFAEWGVDMLKYDSCYHMGRIGTPQISFNRFKVMSDALRATGRNILLNLCNWGEDQVHTWGMSISNSWRITGDIYDSFTRPDDLCGCNTMPPGDPSCIAPGTHCSVLFILNKVAPFADRSIPGGWSDLDMLEVGQGGMTDEEYKAHFALWAALKSPLFLGNDLRDMPAPALTIINNPAIIALSQDPHGRSVTRVRRDTNVAKDVYGQGETHVWAGYLANGDQVVILLNAAAEDLDMSISLAEIFTPFGPHGSAPHVQYDWAVHDLWAHRMAQGTAEELLGAKTEGERAAVLKKAEWYNATETPYEQGLRDGDARLFGEKIGVVKAGGDVEARVKSHSAKVFRLRRVVKEGEKFKGKSIDRVAKDEL